MALPFYNWSRTAASNASADSTINWAEGQAPSSVNDSARAMMASTAAYRDDISGATFTGGTSTAYTLSTYQVFDTLAHLDLQMIAFTPHVTNGASAQINVDGLGSRAIQSSPGVNIPAGTLVQGTPYVATYYNSGSAFVLQGFYSNPYSIPLGGAMPFYSTLVPNSSFAFMYGQAISRTTYSTLFGLFSTVYGVGDGTTTFNIPDLRGRAPIGADNMGGVAAGRLTGVSGMGTGILGTVGGNEAEILVTNNLPPYTPAGTIANGAITIGGASGLRNVSADNNNNGGGGGTFGALSSTPTTLSPSQGASTFTGTAQGGTSAPISLVQPSFCSNYILRII